ncbi:MAG: formylglycine-generating enzyme family protein [Lentisphaeria bacterium]|nr:formylglycine-generating enzyme family protein [Lentisphaeria bacterium]
MLIQYHPRFTLKHVRFHALSCEQLCGYLANLPYSSDKDEDKVLIEEVYNDMLDSLYDGSFIQWLKQLEKPEDELKEIESVVKPFIVPSKILMDLAEILFDSIPEGLKRNLKGKIEEEQSSKSEGTIEPKKDLVLKLNNQVTLEMVWVDVNVEDEKNRRKPYDFYMGSDEADSYDDEKSHKVNLTHGYWLAKYPVTQKQWEIIDKNETTPRAFFHGENNPMESISWEDAGNFCEKLNRLLASKIEKSVFKKGGEEYHYSFALPTEAQWEFAARGGVKSEGYKYSGSNDVNEVAWYYENSGDKYLDDKKWDIEKVYKEGKVINITHEDILNKFQTHPVGQKMPNELGIHDMSGNVWEWCRDCCEWDDKTKTVITDTYEDGITDPCCEVGSRRVFRGGSWRYTARDCRPSCRLCLAPTGRYFDVGFRVALVPVQG